ncbi:MAG TPA: HAMP domain-containing protein [Oligoflexus sp.]|uniref:HAMP domain-containing protein n=1 Tax=Oligoflexus sp. TaxID=1971216 RepID=UPI002D36E4A4|nr:HAMP domain-containing protein [Oligoflexus sp.]HYX36883.1 HAMP domain-containing protein [Oligoflexus sp.]
MSIKLRLFLLVCTTLLMALLLITSFNVYNMDDLLTKELQVRGQIISDAFAAEASDSIIIEDEISLNRITDKLFKNQNVVYSVIYDHDSSIIIEKFNENLNKEKLSELGIPDESKVLIGTRPILDNNNVAIYDFLSKVQSDKGSYGFVRVGISSQNVVDQKKKALIQSLFMAFLSLTVGSILSYFVALSVSSPLNYLKEKFDLISNGHLDEKIVIDRHDEIGSLGNSFILLQNTIIEKIKTIEESNRSLEKRVEDRTREILVQKRKSDKLIESIPLGILTIEPDGSIGEKYSPETEIIFSRNNLRSTSFEDLILKNSHLNPDRRSMCVSAIFSTLNEHSLNFEVNRSCFVDRVELPVNGDIKTLELSWSYIEDENRLVESIMLCIKDISMLQILKEQDRIKDREISKINAIISINESLFFEHFNGIRKLVMDTIDKSVLIDDVNNSSLIPMQRCLHTLKGNCRALNFDELAELAHNFESKIEAAKKSGFISRVYIEGDLQMLRDLYQVYEDLAKRIGRLPVSSDGQLFRISRDDLAMLENAAFSLSETDLLRNRMMGIVARSTGVHVSQILTTIVKESSTICEKLHKVPVKFTLDDGSIFFKRKYASTLDSIFGHLVKNSIAHSLERDGERIQNSKHEYATISVVCRHNHNNCTVEILYTDDGMGLDIKKISEKASQRGLIAANEDNFTRIANSIFYPGFSTSNEVNMYAGRGIGMDAIKDDIQRILGGKIVLVVPEGNHLADFIPFKVKLTLPNEIYYHV